MTTASRIYTIGYATKPIATFISQLQRYNIAAVADVRSVPYSKVFHDYHKENISRHLRQHGIHYVYVGDELGPRSKDPQHYDESGQVQFDRLMTSPLFAQGISRIENGLTKGLSIALMCAEKDPATCHRSLLVGYFLQRQLSLGDGINENTAVLHIDHQGEVETQVDLEQRLCEDHNLNVDLFMSDAERKQQAYQQQLKKTSYIKTI